MGAADEASAQALIDAEHETRQEKERRLEAEMERSDAEHAKKQEGLHSIGGEMLPQRRHQRPVVLFHP